MPGILLAALAVQFVLNGIGEFVRLLEAGGSEGNFHAIVGDAHFDTTLAPIDRSFAASLRSSPVTISVPQCVNIAQGTCSFMHQPSWACIDAWPISTSPRLRTKDREIVAPSPM